MAYVYRGTKLDALEPEPVRRAPGVFNPDRCGTTSGYNQHQVHGTPACRPCKDAQSEYRRAYYERIGGRPRVKAHSDRKRGTGKAPKNGTGCGTYNGHAAHKRDGTPACDPCKAAAREYKRVREQAKAVGAAKAVAVFDPSRCGTRAGYQQHYRHRIPACLPCRSANAEHGRTWRAKAVAA
jgi:hypothetical protein